MTYPWIEKAGAASTLGKILKNFKGESATKDLGSIQSFVDQIVNLAIGFAGIIALVMFMYGAFTYVTSYGDESKIENAKKTLLWSILGLAVISTAWFLANFVEKSLT